MRVTFVGASPLAVAAARAMTERGHEVILIDRDPEKIESLSETLDCGLVTGDGSRPAVLEEVSAEHTDFLFAVSDSDKANVLAALVGRSLGFGRVVPKIEDPDLEPICTELGLDDVIVPDREVATRLLDLVEGRESPELTTVVRSGLRFFGIRVPEGVHVVADLDLPAEAHAIARTRGDDSVLADSDTRIESGDEIVVIAKEDAIETLRERFAHPDAEDAKDD